MSSKTAPDPAPASWSLAARLTLWYTASSFVLIAASTGFLYWSLSQKLESEDDQFLLEKVQLVRLLLRDRIDLPLVLPRDLPWTDSRNGDASFHLRVQDSAGRTLLMTAGMDDLLSTMRFPEAEEPGAIRSQEHRLSDGRSFRLAAVRIREEGGSARIIQVAMDRTHEEDLLAAYRWNLVLVLGLALLGATALGYRIARQGIRPVEAIAATAGRIRSSTLDERIDLSGLPGELRALADTFNAMLDRLEDSFARLRQFSADLAHELRTPVNNLRGEIEVTLGRARTVEEYRDALGSSLEECGRLAAMIDSLLFLARAENPRTVIDREPLDVAAELTRVCEFYEAAAAEAGVHLRVLAGPVGRARLNRPLFQRAVANLVANALAHTPAGETVTLSAAGDADTLRVEVADRGCGIPAEHLPHVFDRFYRVDRSRTSGGGVGLGLAIVRGIVELHGGSVAITSTPGQGTQVVMTFPRNDRAPER